MTLGDRIRSLRTEKNLSQSELAEALEVSRQSISKWETDGAVPDLDKLVGMSEIFGVTLDALVKGAPPECAAAPCPEPPQPKTASHSTPGIILLCFGVLIVLLFLWLGSALAGLMFASPFLLSGVICLLTRQRTGLWCGWAVFLCVDLYLRYATGVNCTIILLTLQFEPEMNYARLAIGWAQFLTALLLLLLTLRSYRKLTLPCDRGHIIPVAVGWAALAGLTALQSRLLLYWRSLPYGQVDDRWYFWLRACGDCIRLWLFAALLVWSLALIRQRRRETVA